MPFHGHYEVRYVDYQGKPLEHVELLIELPGCAAVASPPDPDRSEKAKLAARARPQKRAIIVEVRSSDSRDPSPPFNGGD